MKIIFSVVIPLYNKEKSIANTVKSVLNQTYSDFELIIINDGSTDNSLKIVQSLHDERIRIINKENGGVSSARNRGICIADGLYIAFLDADDIWLPSYLQEIKSLIDEFPDCKIFCTDYTVSPLNIENSSKAESRHYIVNNYFERSMNIAFLNASAIVIDKYCLNSEMQFNEKFTHGEDLDLWSRFYKKYGHIGYSDAKLVYYNHSAHNRACNLIPRPSNHFAYYLNFDETKESIENRYNLHQISLLTWLYLKTFKIKYLFDILLKYRKYILQIFVEIFNHIINNEYKKLIKTK